MDKRAGEFLAQPNQRLAVVPAAFARHGAAALLWLVFVCNNRALWLVRFCGCPARHGHWLFPLPCQRLPCMFQYLSDLLFKFLQNLPRIVRVLLWAVALPLAVAAVGAWQLALYPDGQAQRQEEIRQLEGIQADLQQDPQRNGNRDPGQDPELEPGVLLCAHP